MITWHRAHSGGLRAMIGCMRATIDPLSDDSRRVVVQIACFDHAGHMVQSCGRIVHDWSNAIQYAEQMIDRIQSGGEE